MEDLLNVISLSSSEDESSDQVKKKSTIFTHDFKIKFDTIFSNHEYMSQKFPYLLFIELLNCIKHFMHNPKFPISAKTCFWRSFLDKIYKPSLVSQYKIHKDIKFNRVLGAIMAEYLNFRCEILKLEIEKYPNAETARQLNGHVKDLCQKLGTTLLHIFNGNKDFVTFALLQVKPDKHYQLLLSSLFSNILSYYNKVTMVDHITYVRLILCFRRWKTLVSHATMKKTINEISRRVLPQNMSGRGSSETRDFLQILPKHKKDKENATNFLINHKLLEGGLLDKAINRYFDAHEEHATILKIPQKRPPFIKSSTLTELNLNIFNNSAKTTATTCADNSASIELSSDDEVICLTNSADNIKDNIDNNLSNIRLGSSNSKDTTCKIVPFSKQTSKCDNSVTLNVVQNVVVAKSDVDSQSERDLHLNNNILRRKKKKRKAFGKFRQNLTRYESTDSNSSNKGQEDSSSVCVRVKLKSPSSRKSSQVSSTTNIDSIVPISPECSPEKCESNIPISTKISRESTQSPHISTSNFNESPLSPVSLPSSSGIVEVSDKIAGSANINPLYSDISDTEIDLNFSTPNPQDSSRSKRTSCGGSVDGVGASCVVGNVDNETTSAHCESMTVNSPDSGVSSVNTNNSKENSDNENISVSQVSPPSSHTEFISKSNIDDEQVCISSPPRDANLESVEIIKTDSDFSIGDRYKRCLDAVGQSCGIDNETDSAHCENTTLHSPDSGVSGVNTNNSKENSDNENISVSQLSSPPSESDFISKTNIEGESGCISSLLPNRNLESDLAFVTPSLPDTNRIIGVIYEGSLDDGYKSCAVGDVDNRTASTHCKSRIVDSSDSGGSSTNTHYSKKNSDNENISVSKVSPARSGAEFITKSSIEVESVFISSLLPDCNLVSVDNTEPLSLPDKEKSEAYVTEEILHYATLENGFVQEIELDEQIDQRLDDEREETKLNKIVETVHETEVRSELETICDENQLEEGSSNISEDSTEVCEEIELSTIEYTHEETVEQTFVENIEILSKKKEAHCPLNESSLPNNLKETVSLNTKIEEEVEEKIYLMDESSITTKNGKAMSTVYQYEEPVTSGCDELKECINTFLQSPATENKNDDVVETSRAYLGDLPSHTPQDKVIEKVSCEQISEINVTSIENKRCKKVDDSASILKISESNIQPDPSPNSHGSHLSDHIIKCMSKPGQLFQRQEILIETDKSNHVEFNKSPRIGLIDPPEILNPKLLQELSNLTYNYCQPDSSAVARKPLTLVLDKKFENISDDELTNKSPITSSSKKTGIVKNWSLSPSDVKSKTDFMSYLKLISNLINPIEEKPPLIISPTASISKGRRTKPKCVRKLDTTKPLNALINLQLLATTAEVVSDKPEISKSPKLSRKKRSELKRSIKTKLNESKSVGGRTNRVPTRSTTRNNKPIDSNLSSPPVAPKSILKPTNIATSKKSFNLYEGIWQQDRTSEILKTSLDLVKIDVSKSAVNQAIPSPMNVSSDSDSDRLVIADCKVQFDTNVKTFTTNGEFITDLNDMKDGSNNESDAVSATNATRRKKLTKTRDGKKCPGSDSDEDVLAIKTHWHKPTKISSNSDDISNWIYEIELLEKFEINFPSNDPFNQYQLPLIVENISIDATLNTTSLYTLFQIRFIAIHRCIKSFDTKQVISPHTFKGVLEKLELIKSKTFVQEDLVIFETHLKDLDHNLRKLKKIERRNEKLTMLYDFLKCWDKRIKLRRKRLNTKWNTKDKMDHWQRIIKNGREMNKNVLNLGNNVLNQKLEQPVSDFAQLEQCYRSPQKILEDTLKHFVISDTETVGTAYGDSIANSMVKQFKPNPLESRTSKRRFKNKEKTIPNLLQEKVSAPEILHAVETKNVVMVNKLDDEVKLNTFSHCPINLAKCDISSQDNTEETHSAGPVHDDNTFLKTNEVLPEPNEVDQIVESFDKSNDDVKPHLVKVEHKVHLTVGENKDESMESSLPSQEIVDKSIGEIKISEEKTTHPDVKVVKPIIDDLMKQIDECIGESDMANNSENSPNRPNSFFDETSDATDSLVEKIDKSLNEDKQITDEVGEFTKFIDELVEETEKVFVEEIKESDIKMNENKISKLVGKIEEPCQKSIEEVSECTKLIDEFVEETEKVLVEEIRESDIAMNEDNASKLVGEIDEDCQMSIGEVGESTILIDEPVEETKKVFVEETIKPEITMKEVKISKLVEKIDEHCQTSIEEVREPTILIDESVEETEKFFVEEIIESDMAMNEDNASKLVGEIDEHCQTSIEEVRECTILIDESVEETKTIFVEEIIGPEITMKGVKISKLIEKIDEHCQTSIEEVREPTILIDESVEETEKFFVEEIIESDIAMNEDNASKLVGEIDEHCQTSIEEVNESTILIDESVEETKKVFVEGIIESDIAMKEDKISKLVEKIDDHCRMSIEEVSDATKLIDESIEGTDKVYVKENIEPDITMNEVKISKLIEKIDEHCQTSTEEVSESTILIDDSVEETKEVFVEEIIESGIKMTVNKISKLVEKIDDHCHNIQEVSESTKLIDESVKETEITGEKEIFADEVAECIIELNEDIISEPLAKIEELNAETDNELDQIDYVNNQNIGTVAIISEPLVENLHNTSKKHAISIDKIDQSKSVIVELNIVNDESHSNEATCDHFQQSNKMTKTDEQLNSDNDTEDGNYTDQNQIPHIDKSDLITIDKESFISNDLIAEVDCIEQNVESFVECRLPTISDSELHETIDMKEDSKIGIAVKPEKQATEEEEGGQTDEPECKTADYCYNHKITPPLGKTINQLVQNEHDKPEDHATCIDQIDRVTENIDKDNVDGTITEYDEKIDCHWKKEKENTDKIDESAENEKINDHVGKDNGKIKTSGTNQIIETIELNVRVDCDPKLDDCIGEKQIPQMDKPEPVTTNKSLSSPSNVIVCVESSEHLKEAAPAECSLKVKSVVEINDKPVMKVDKHKINPKEIIPETITQTVIEPTQSCDLIDKFDEFKKKESENTIIPCRNDESSIEDNVLVDGEVEIEQVTLSISQVEDEISNEQEQKQEEFNSVIEYHSSSESSVDYVEMFTKTRIESRKSIGPSKESEEEDELIQREDKRKKVVQEIQSEIVKIISNTSEELRLREENECDTIKRRTSMSPETDFKCKIPKIENILSPKVPNGTAEFIVNENSYSDSSCHSNKSGIDFPEYLVTNGAPSSSQASFSIPLITTSATLVAKTELPANEAKPESSDKLDIVESLISKNLSCNSQTDDELDLDGLRDFFCLYDEFDNHNVLDRSNTSLNWENVFPNSLNLSLGDLNMDNESSSDKNASLKKDKDCMISGNDDIRIMTPWDNILYPLSYSMDSAQQTFINMDCILENKYKMSPTVVSSESKIKNTVTNTTEPSSYMMVDIFANKSFDEVIYNEDQSNSTLVDQTIKELSKELPTTEEKATESPTPLETSIKETVVATTPPHDDFDLVVYDPQGETECNIDSPNQSDPKNYQQTELITINHDDIKENDSKSGNFELINVFLNRRKISKDPPEGPIEILSDSPDSSRSSNSSSQEILSPIREDDSVNEEDSSLPELVPIGQGVPLVDVNLSPLSEGSNSLVESSSPACGDGSPSRKKDDEKLDENDIILKKLLPVSKPKSPENSKLENNEIPIQYKSTPVPLSKHIPSPKLKRTPLLTDVIPSTTPPFSHNSQPTSKPEIPKVSLQKSNSIPNISAKLGKATSFKNGPLDMPTLDFDEENNSITQFIIPKPQSTQLYPPLPPPLVRIQPPPPPDVSQSAPSTPIKQHIAKVQPVIETRAEMNSFLNASVKRGLKRPVEDSVSHSILKKTKVDKFDLVKSMPLDKISLPHATSISENKSYSASHHSTTSLSDRRPSINSPLLNSPKLVSSSSSRSLSPSTGVSSSTSNVSRRHHTSYSSSSAKNREYRSSSLVNQNASIFSKPYPYTAKPVPTKYVPISTPPEPTLRTYRSKSRLTTEEKPHNTIAPKFKVISKGGREHSYSSSSSSITLLSSSSSSSKSRLSSSEKITCHSRSSSNQQNYRSTPKNKYAVDLYSKLVEIESNKTKSDVFVNVAPSWDPKQCSTDELLEDLKKAASHRKSNSSQLFN